MRLAWLWHLLRTNAGALGVEPEDPLFLVSPPEEDAVAAVLHPATPGVLRPEEEALRLLSDATTPVVSVVCVGADVPCECLVSGRVGVCTRPGCEAHRRLQESWPPFGFETSLGLGTGLDVAAMYASNGLDWPAVLYRCDADPEPGPLVGRCMCGTGEPFEYATVFAVDDEARLSMVRWVLGSLTEGGTLFVCPRSSPATRSTLVLRVPVPPPRRRTWPQENSEAWTTLEHAFAAATTVLWVQFGVRVLRPKGTAALHAYLLKTCARSADLARYDLSLYAAPAVGGGRAASRALVLPPYGPDVWRSVEQEWPHWCASYVEAHTRDVAPPACPAVAAAVPPEVDAGESVRLPVVPTVPAGHGAVRYVLRVTARCGTDRDVLLSALSMIGAQCPAVVRLSGAALVGVELPAPLVLPPGAVYGDLFTSLEVARDVEPSAVDWSAGPTLDTREEASHRHEWVRLRHASAEVVRLAVPLDDRVVHTKSDGLQLDFEPTALFPRTADVPVVKPGRPLGALRPTPMYGATFALEPADRDKETDVLRALATVFAGRKARVYVLPGRPHTTEQSLLFLYVRTTEWTLHEHLFATAVTLAKVAFGAHLIRMFDDTPQTWGGATAYVLAMKALPGEVSRYVLAGPRLGPDVSPSFGPHARHAYELPAGRADLDRLLARPVVDRHRRVRLYRSDRRPDDLVLNRPTPPGKASLRWPATTGADLVYEHPYRSLYPPSLHNTN